MDFPSAATQPLIGRRHGAGVRAPLTLALPGAAICMALIGALALAVGTSQRSSPGDGGQPGERRRLAGSPPPCQAGHGVAPGPAERAGIRREGLNRRV